MDTSKLAGLNPAESAEILSAANVRWGEDNLPPPKGLVREVIPEMTPSAKSAPFNGVEYSEHDLAEIAVNERGIEPGWISGWVADETGYSIRSALTYLDQKYKDPIRVASGKLTPAFDAGPSPRPLSAALVSRGISVAVDLDSPGGLKKAAKALEREAKKKAKAEKTPPLGRG